MLLDAECEKERVDRDAETGEEANRSRGSRGAAEEDGCEEAARSRSPEDPEGVVDAEVEPRRVGCDEVGVGVLSEDLAPSCVDGDVEVPRTELVISEVEDEPGEEDATGDQGERRQASFCGLERGDRGDE